MLLRNYLNYSGSKDRVYPILRTYLEKAVGRSHNKILIDMFTGSGVVAFNSLDLFKSIICIDKCNELVRLHNWVLYTPVDKLLEQA